MSAAARMARYRERQRGGLRVLPTVIDEVDFAERMIEANILPRDFDGNLDALTEAANFVLAHVRPVDLEVSDA